ncbi:MAG: hypothetical protein M1820_009132 [Bogoriella megaspora]|nr:MAG: hypothetical protein M1820_009132 [Bogoriella megaspora]
MTRLGPTPYFLGIATVEQGIDTLVWAFLVVFDILFIQGFARIYGELGSYINPYSYGVTQIDWGAWTFGQILGVTIWAPVVVEWLYVSIWGIERASRYRISRPFRVIKDQGDEIVIDPLPSYSKLRRAESDTDYMLDSSSKSTFHRTNSSLPDSLSQKGAIKTSLSPEIIVEEPSGAVVRDK